MKTKLILGHVDLDGISGHVLAKHYKLDETYDLVSKDYDMLSEESSEAFTEFLSTYEEVVFYDFAPTPGIYDNLIAKGITVYIFDHHLTSEHFKDFPNCVIDDKRCGTKLFFEEFILKRFRTKSIIREFVELVNTYDLYKRTDPKWEDAHNLNRTMYGMGDWDVSDDDRVKKYWKYINSALLKFEKVNEWFWTQREKDIISKAVKKENIMYDEALSAIQFRTDTQGKKFGLIKIPYKISIVAARLLDEHTEIAYIIILNNYSDDKNKISYRSRTAEEYDCTKSLFANGHKCAAGGDLWNRTLWDDFFTGKLNSLPLESEEKIVKEIKELYYTKEEGGES